MQIIFNDQLMQCDDNITVTTFLDQINQNKPGIALAINQQILPREQWGIQKIYEGDQILLFQIIAGG